MDINFSNLIDSIISAKAFHQKLFDLLDDEFRSLYTPKERRDFLNHRSEESEKIMD